MGETKDFKLYCVLFVLSTFFTILDLVASGFQLMVPTLIFSSLTMIIGIFGRHKLKTSTFNQYVDNTMVFIKKNFGRSNIIFSILDVACCIIALVSCFYIIALISRCVLALRLATIINKYKNVAYAMWSIVFIYLFKRGEDFKMAENENVIKSEKKSFFSKIKNGVMNGLKWVFKSNPQASLATLVNAFLSTSCGIAINANALTDSIPKLCIGEFDIIPPIISIALFVLVEVFGIKWAFESNGVASARIENEKMQKAVKKNEKAKLRAEKEAEKQLERDRLDAIALQAKLAKEKEDAIEKAKREAYLLELAQKIEAEQKSVENTQVSSGVTQDTNNL